MKIQTSAPRGGSIMSEPLTLEKLEAALSEVNALGPIPGAMIVVEYWKARIILEVEVSAMTDEGWRTMEDLIGAEGVKILSRHERQKVVILDRDTFDALPVMEAADALAPFGARPYRLHSPPERRVDSSLARPSHASHRKGDTAHP